LTIVGDGSEREKLEIRSKEKGLGSKIQFCGRVRQEETAQFYKHADIFCFPSLREFGGAVVLEAMGAGLPCVIVDYGGMSEYIEEGQGIKIAPRSREYIVNKVAQEIEKLVLQPALRATLGRAARERARQFEWGVKADILIQLYQNMIHEKCAKLM
jgi:glycosyltransferase involved in cell wall biosynthesis